MRSFYMPQRRSLNHFEPENAERFVRCRLHAETTGRSAHRLSLVFILDALNYSQLPAIPHCTVKYTRI